MPKPAPSWLIVGLGNPGEPYARTRHNLGARVVETLPEVLGQKPLRRDAQLHAGVSSGTHTLAVPTLFMNDSGRAVQALLQYFRFSPESLLVVHDDKDLAFGERKMQQDRSSAGHRGVQSVIDSLQTDAFWRLRIGIGAPPPNVETDAYVLQPFTAEERQVLLEHVIPESVEAIRKHLDVAPAHA